MKPIEQTKLKAPDGNCYAACIASIFEVPLDGVPQPTREEGSSIKAWEEYVARLDRVFYRPRGLYALVINPAENWRPLGYSILCAKSPRGDYPHCVVALDGEVVWDPHPDRDMGLGEIVDWTIFVMRDAAEVLE